MSPGPGHAVVYAVHREDMVAFYTQVLGLQVHEVDDAFTTLISPEWSLDLVQVPPDVAVTMDMRVPPVIREDGAIKLVFTVDSLTATRERCQDLGGRLVDEAAEWTFRGFVHANGVDPEGNVFLARCPE